MPLGLPPYFFFVHRPMHFQTLGWLVAKEKKKDQEKQNGKEVWN